MPGDYPGLPNWNYNADVPTLLSMFGVGPEARLKRAQTENLTQEAAYRKAQAANVPLEGQHLQALIDEIKALIQPKVAHMGAETEGLQQSTAASKAKLPGELDLQTAEKNRIMAATDEINKLITPKMNQLMAETDLTDARKVTEDFMRQPNVEKTQAETGVLKYQPTHMRNTEALDLYQHMLPTGPTGKPNFYRNALEQDLYGSLTGGATAPAQGHAAQPGGVPTVKNPADDSGKQALIGMLKGSRPGHVGDVPMSPVEQRNAGLSDLLQARRNKAVNDKRMAGSGGAPAVGPVQPPLSTQGTGTAQTGGTGTGAQPTRVFDDRPPGLQDVSPLLHRIAQYLNPSALVPPGGYAQHLKKAFAWPSGAKPGATNTPTSTIGAP